MNDSLLVLNHDDIIKQPYNVVHKVEQFIGVTPKIKPEWIYYDQRKGFFCKYVDYKRNISECMPSTKGRPHAVAQPETVKKFKQFFYPFNERFFYLIGQDFGWNNAD